MEVYKAINSVAGDMAKKGIAKDKRAQGYMFRGIDDVYGALAPLLAEHKLCILPRVIDREVIERETSNGKAIFYVTLKVEFDFVSAEDGSKHTVSTYGEAMDLSDKATNKAMSAAYKYAAFQAFCIPVQGDNDTENNNHEVSYRSDTDLINGLINAISKAKNIPELSRVVDHKKTVQCLSRWKTEMPQEYDRLMGVIEEKRSQLEDVNT